jgi:hypothetical protein
VLIVVAAGFCGRCFCVRVGWVDCVFSLEAVSLAKLQTPVEQELSELLDVCFVDAISWRRCDLDRACFRAF